MDDIKNHSQYDDSINDVIAIRDAITGSSAVKSKGYTYLPHPSEIEKSTPSGRARYKQYLAGAEWDGFPAQTLRSMIGKMNFDLANVDFPEQIQYLIQDADGDGNSIKSIMTSCANNIIPVKFHVLVADYNGVPNLNDGELSLEMLRAINPRAKIKQYSRENTLNWYYSKINGQYQLSFIIFKEKFDTFDESDFSTKQKEQYLVLALDENGNYYQQVILEEEDDVYIPSDKNYVTINGETLKWIPCQIVTDVNDSFNSIPSGFGYLKPICDLAYSRYIVSAEYKEAMRNLPPTTYTNGWTEQAWETFKQVNGRDYILTGSNAVNNMPDGVSVNIVGADTELGGYERYFEDNKKKAQALGAVFKADSYAKTATEVEVDSSEQNAVLVDVANGIESAIKRIVAYCAMFEGIIPQDSIEESLDMFVIELKKDFGNSKLTVEQVREVQNLYLNGLYTQKMAIESLVKGGWADEEAEKMLGILEENP